MPIRFLSLVVLIGLTSTMCVAAGNSPVIVTPDKIHWQAGTGAMKGAEIAVTSGNPEAAGEYTMRLRLPDGAKFGPHFHGDVENVTVLQGTLMVGLGDTVNAAKMVALPAGSFASVPKGLHHYATAKGVTIIQISGMGPESMTMVGMKKK